jgi:hypothetical protein
MRSLLQLYRVLNILSIDVVAGAVICALYFAQVFQVQILAYGLVALALTVWIIYTTDHLRDARKIGKIASSKRHQFHQANFNTLLLTVAVALLVDCLMLFFIRKQVFVWGAWLIAFVALYLLLHRKFAFLKEFFVAIMYMAGVLLLSLAVTTMAISWLQVGLMMQFFILALLNLLIFSWYDSESDSSDNLSSFVTRFGKPFTEKFIRFLFAILFAFNISQLILSGAYRYILVATLMMIVLFLIFIFPRVFGRNDFYRLLGDSIFMFPIVILL